MTRSQALDKIMETFELRKGTWDADRQQFLVEGMAQCPDGQLVTRAYVMEENAFDIPGLKDFITNRMKKSTREAAAHHLGDRPGEKGVTPKEFMELAKLPDFRTVDRYSPEELAVIDEDEIGRMGDLRYFILRAQPTT